MGCSPDLLEQFSRSTWSTEFNQVHGSIWPIHSIHREKNHHVFFHVFPVSDFTGLGLAEELLQRDGEGLGL